jgi:hypothetical protein
MFATLSRLFKSLLCGPWLCATVLVGCLALSGCQHVDSGRQHVDLRGEKFPEDELSGLSRRLRPRDTETEPAGMSNKARQIEGNLGAR